MISGSGSEDKTAISAEREVFSLHCYRCGHAWYTRNDQIPKRCPRCHSARWEYPLTGELTCRYCGHNWKSSSICEPCPECKRMQIKGGTERFLHCNQCDYDWIQKRSEPPKKCPLCRSDRWKEPKANRLSCKKCGHVWINKAKEPKRCPNCQTIYWNAPNITVQCRRCGHEWSVSPGRTPEDVKMCPSCKSRKWNETPRIFVCFRCGKTHIMRTNGEVKVCPTCGGSNDTRLMICNSCGYTWNAIPVMKGLDCPRCGKETDVRDCHNSELLEFWTDGIYKLKYTADDGFGIVYLWKEDIPIITVYFHEMCRDLGITADHFVMAVNSKTMNDEWSKLARKMIDRQDDYRKLIGYFEMRLRLNKKDAEILSIHFKGMGPEAIALRFGMSYGDVKESFGRIMEAFANTGINVDDTVFTENPFNFY